MVSRIHKVVLYSHEMKNGVFMLTQKRRIFNLFFLAPQNNISPKHLIYEIFLYFCSKNYHLRVLTQK